MFEAIGFPVAKLKRVQFGPIALSGLPRGKYRVLLPNEIKELRDAALRTHNIQKKNNECRGEI